MNNFENNLMNISNIEEGWYNGEGKPCDKDKLEQFLQRFLTFYNADLPFPATFPHVDAGLQFEWANTDFDISLTIDVDALKGDFHSLQFKNDAVVAQELDLNEKESWDFINEFIEENFK